MNDAGYGNNRVDGNIPITPTLSGSALYCFAWRRKYCVAVKQSSTGVGKGNSGASRYLLKSRSHRYQKGGLLIVLRRLCIIQELNFCRSNILNWNDYHPLFSDESSHHRVMRIYKYWSFFTNNFFFCKKRNILRWMKTDERKLKQIINHIHWLFYLLIQTPIPRHGRRRAPVRVPRCGLWVGRPEHRHRQSDHLVTNKEENERTLNNTNRSIGDLTVHFSPTQLLCKTVLFDRMWI